jgi:branched-chain amino acid transport system permease protein
MLRLVNFAHGAFYAIGAYVGLVVTERFGLAVGIIAAPLAVAVFALAFDRLLLRRFYDKEPTSQILVTFGVAIVVEETLRLIFTGTTRSYVTPAWVQSSLNLGFATRLTVSRSERASCCSSSRSGSLSAAPITG